MLLITTAREGRGASEVLPLQKKEGGGGAEKVLDMLKRGTKSLQCHILVMLYATKLRIIEGVLIA